MAGLLDMGLGSLIGPVVEKVLAFIPDPAEKAKAAAAMQSEMLNFVVGVQAQQTEINKVEAASTSLFVAGWRPFIGWIGGVAFAWVYVGGPIVYVVTGHGTPVPLDHLWELMGGILGLGGMRSYDKKQGTS